MVLESHEKQEFVSLADVTKKLGQVQYISRFINPDKRFHEDGTPFFSDIRIEGDPDDYYNLKIHRDDVRSFIKKWFEYKKVTNPFFLHEKLDDFI